MKIDSERSPVNLEFYIRGCEKSKGVNQSLRQEQQGALPRESLKLFHTAKEIQKIREIVEATPEIRTDLVGKLKREIETGTYSVNVDREAEKMLRESLIEKFI